MKYTPPSTQHLQALKTALGATGVQMAELFGLAGDQQWRKYTGGHDPREMSPQMLFFGAAKLVLTDEEIERIAAKMREIGADVAL
jgi:hypothetical protein